MTHVRLREKQRPGGQAAVGIGCVEFYQAPVGLLGLQKTITWAPEKQTKFSPKTGPKRWASCRKWVDFMLKSAHLGVLRRREV